MREKTSNKIIKIDYSDEKVKAKIDSNLDKLASVTTEDMRMSKKHHLTRFSDQILPKSKTKRLNLEDYRIIKQNKSKIITNELEKHRVRSWLPSQ